MKVGQGEPYLPLSNLCWQMEGPVLLLASLFFWLDLLNSYHDESYDLLMIDESLVFKRIH